MGGRPKVAKLAPLEMDRALPKKRGRPAKTLEARENQLIAMSMDVIEEQLRDRTASSQILTEFARRGSVKEQLEKEKLRQEVEALKAKVEAMKASITSEEVYKNALDAMRSYTGSNVEVYED
jgi:hypothetical protein